MGQWLTLNVNGRIWKWRTQYGELLGGLGTGIGEGDRGVPCGRESACCGSIEREQETDCDAEDARLSISRNNSSSSGISSLTGGGYYGSASHSPPSQHHQHQQQNAGSWVLSSTLSTTPPYSDAGSNSRTPSPQLRPGYARHEVEGIGGVVKTVGVRVVKVGACVPEWEDEKHRGLILGREVSGRARSWCGWCWRVIPGKKDLEMNKHGLATSPCPSSDIRSGPSMQLSIR